MEDISSLPALTSQPDLWKNIPPELQSLRQWMVAGPDPKGTFKAPYGRDSRLSDHTNPSNYLFFEEAVEIAKSQREANRGAWGIGFVFTEDDPYSCIDLDVKEGAPDDQQQKNWGLAQLFNSYTEQSTGGKGLHILVRGDIGSGCRHAFVEIYSKRRFMVFTGKVVINEPIKEGGSLLLDLVSSIRQRQGQTTETELVELGPELEDCEVYGNLINGPYAEKFNTLCNCTSDSKSGAKDGSYIQLKYQSQSEADMALMSMLCSYSVSNEQCRRIFRMTGLGKREKATKNDKYLNTTIRNARSRNQDTLASVLHGKQASETLLINAGFAHADHVAQVPSRFDVVK